MQYGSGRCKRVIRSVMEPEVYAFILGFDEAFVIRCILTELIGRRIDTSADAIRIVDSRTLFYRVAKDGATNEKWLLVDIWALRECYVKGELKSFAVDTM